MARFKKIDCVAEIRKKLAKDEDVSEAYIEEKVSEIEAALEQAQRSGQLSGVSTLEEITKKLTQRSELNAKRAKALILLGIKSELKMDQKIYALKGGGLNAGDAIVAKLVGVWKRVFGAQMSTDALQKTRFSQVLGAMLKDFSKHPGLLEKIKDGNLDTLIAKEMWQRTLKSSASDNVDAFNAARILAKHLEVGRLMLNRAGAFVDRIIMSGYIPVYHDVAAMSRMGQTAWVNMIQPLMEIDRVLVDAVPEKAGMTREQQLTDFLNMVWVDSTLGRERLPPEIGQIRVETPRNLAKAMSKRRVLHFKDSASYMLYKEKMGGKTPILYSILKKLEMDSMTSVLMEEWGPRPENGFKNLLARESHLASGKAKETLEGRTWKGMLLRSYWSEVSGDSNIAVNPKMAVWAGAARAWINMSKLGRVVWQSLTDIPSMMLGAHYHGMSPFDGIHTAMVSQFRGPLGKEQREMLNAIGVFADGVLFGIHKRFASMDSIPGEIGKMHERFFKYTGLKYWTDRNKEGFALLLSYNLGQKQAVGFGNLDKVFRDTLSRYAIGEDEWKLVQKIKKGKVDGREYVTPDLASTLSDADVNSYIRSKKLEEGASLEVAERSRARATKAIEDKITKEQLDAFIKMHKKISLGGARDKARAMMVAKWTQRGIDKFARESGIFEKVKAEVIESTRRRVRDDLELKLRTYILNEIEFAVPTPGARERAMLKFGFKRGDPVGEAIRFIMQYKLFPATIATKVYGRMGFSSLTPVDAFRSGGMAGILSDIGKKVDIAPFAGMLVASTAFGYLAGAVKDLQKGILPRDPRRLDTLEAAFVNGGGAGIYGDFIFAEYNRFGRGALETLAGPALGEAGDLLRIGYAMRHGDDSKAKILRFALNNTPFLNLHFTRLALDHAIIYRMQEAMNPGYMQRRKRNLENKTGQREWIESSVGKP